MKEHGKKYDTVKRYYDSGMWSLTAVKNAVIKGWITSEEYAEITGEVYA